MENDALPALESWSLVARRFHLLRDDAAKLLETKCTNLKLCPDVMSHEDKHVAQQPEALSSFFGDFEKVVFKIVSPTKFGNRYYLTFLVL